MWANAVAQTAGDAGVLIDQSATMQVRLVDGGEAADAERPSLTADLSVLLVLGAGARPCGSD